MISTLSDLPPSAASSAAALHLPRALPQAPAPSARRAAPAAGLGVAVVGARAFLVSDGRGPLRPAADGPLSIDTDGYIVDRAQGRLLGWPMRGDAHERLPRPAPLRATLTAARARATRLVTVGLQLDARCSPLADAPRDLSHPAGWQHAFSVTVYTQDGVPSALVCGLRKTAADEWMLALVDEDGLLLTGTPWRLRFDADSGRICAGSAVLNVALGGQRIRFDFSAACQVAGPCAVPVLRQDGRDAQSLHGVTIDSAGVVSAHYEGGGSLTLGRTRQPL
jgi:flagellar hook protein FlgE